MNYREKAFTAKFNDAARHLNVTPDKVISLKLRDNVSSYSEYHDLLHVLEHEIGLQWHEVKGNLQGRGYLVGDTKAKAVIVEHETGLEILFIAGSIASLVGIIPLILQCWSSIRSHFGRHHPQDPRSVEIRRLDRNGRLLEDRAHGIVTPLSAPFSFINTALTSAAEVLDAEIKTIRDDVKALAARVKSLEKKVSKPSKPHKKSVKKNKTT
jgi:hypothetical protein